MGAQWYLMVFNLMVFNRNNYTMEFAGVYPTLTFNENRSDQKPATHGNTWFTMGRKHGILRSTWLYESESHPIPYGFYGFF